MYCMYYHTQFKGSPERKDTWGWRHIGKGNAGVSHSVLRQRKNQTHTHMHTTCTHTHTHSAVKISTNPVYYLPPLCTLPLFFILSLSHFLPGSPLLLFFLSLLLKPILVAVARTHRLTHTRCQFTPVMFVGLGLRRGNREGSVDVCCSLPAPALFTSCRENYLPFVCVKGLLPLPSVQRIQWQACVCLRAHVCVCASLHVHVFPCVCACFCKTVE